jgi:hypothetical protein
MSEMTLRQAILAAKSIVLFFNEGDLRINKVQATTLRKKGNWLSEDQWDGEADVRTWSLKDGRLNMHWSS